MIDEASAEMSTSAAGGAPPNPPNPPILGRLGSIGWGRCSLASGPACMYMGVHMYMYMGQVQLGERTFEGGHVADVHWAVGRMYIGQLGGWAIGQLGGWAIGQLGN